MPNQYTINASYEIEHILSKLWVEGDISSYDKDDIMEVVRDKLERVR